MANSKQYILGLFPDNNNNEISAADMRIFVNAIFDEEVDTTAIVDNLFSTDGQVPLSANQGRILNGKITTVETDVNNKEDSLGLGSNNQVLTIDQNNNKVWRTPVSYDQVTVYDALDSVSSSLALSANQGRILDSKASANSGKIQTNITNININRGLIDNNIQDIATNVTSIDINAAGITTAKSDILINAAGINTNLNNIANNLSLINTNISDIDANRVLIDANGVSILALNDDIIRIDGEISVIDGRITINEADILALQIQLGMTDLAALEAQVALNTLNTNNNTVNISSNLAQIGLNSAAISTNTISIGINSQNVNTNTQNISTNTSDISTLTTRVLNTEVDIADMNPRIDQNQTDILSNLAKIQTNETAIQTNVDVINTNKLDIQRNKTDILANKQDIEILQTETDSNTSNIAANYVLIQNNLSNYFQLDGQQTAIMNDAAALALEVAGKEEDLGAPQTNGYILASMVDGTRIWVENAFSATEFSVVDNITSNGNTFDALSANQGYVLDQKIAQREPYLGKPTKDGMILSGDENGTRAWVEANILSVDYGTFFGDGFTLVSIAINTAISGIINNRAENATKQYTCIGTFTDGTNNINVDISERVTWSSTNLEAFTVNNGIGGGLVRPTTQLLSFSSPGSYLAVDTRQVTMNATFTYKLETSNASSIIEIDNNPEVNSIRLEPSGLVNLNVSATQQYLAYATYTHSNWAQYSTNITDGGTYSTVWSSDDVTVATTLNNGFVTALNIGSTLINAANNGYSASSQVTVNN